MKIIVFGANGSTGRQIVSHATSRGHEVVAAVRRPDTLSDVDGIEVREIDLADEASLERAIGGGDVVVSALGHGSVSAASKPTTLYSDSTRALRRAMRAVGASRIIVLSSGGVVADDAAPWFYRALLRKQLINTYLDMARMESILEESEDLDWTALRLTYLREGASKPYIVEEGRIGRGNFQIHFTDVGRFVAEEIDARAWVRAHPVIGYPN